jgi:UDP-N-acetylmuramoyl-L-alanyl-D-glutamate--2,6-diaminopimelate ligase
MDSILRKIKKLIPTSVFQKLQPFYHYGIAVFGATKYRFPSRKIFVIGITGTKGKSSTTEILNAILEEAGYKIGMVNGIRFKIGAESTPNKLKMTMPGRALIQKYIRKAVDEKCDYFILEMTSEGTKQFRHKFINLDTLIFTNLSPEHIESHGSYENYVKAKLEIANELGRSSKKTTTIIANADDPASEKFLAKKATFKKTFSLKDLSSYETKKDGLIFTFGKDIFTSPLLGEFNLYNILAAISFARSINISDDVTKKALEKFNTIRGRVEHVTVGQDFEVVVDYAHTEDSLRQFYSAFEGKRKICVLGSTGGGRDKWKRPLMGGAADSYCETIILTNEDPYDEDPTQIINEVASGIKNHKPIIILDRREAIARAISEVKQGDTVLITGKGTDPYIMGPNGQKTPWDDAKVAKEELQKVLIKM